MLYNLTFLLLSWGDICYFPVIQLVNFLEEAPVQYSHYTYYLYLREKKEQRAKKKKKRSVKHFKKCVLPFGLSLS